MKLLQCFSILFLISSCQIHQLGVKSESLKESSLKDTIVFITMRMRFDTMENKNNIELLKILKKPGTLKKRLIENTSPENYLNCITFNDKNNVIDSFSVEHPLYKEVESPDEKNQFLKTSVKLKESEFFLRFEKKNYNSLTVKENTTLIKNNKLININF